MVINPRRDYGHNLNPCLDCKSFMVQKAYEWTRKNNFDFIITGEVIGQRPMSQRRNTMPVVQKESGAGDLLLRPLCAQHLPPTRPEREGWVDRDQLLSFNGRSRKPQIALAEQFGFSDYAQPAGGCCFLTDKAYSRKLTDLWQARGERRYELDDIMLLKVGRHIRPRDDFKLIVGREEGENNFLEGYRKQFVHLRCISHRGPLVLVDGRLHEKDVELAARIAARYSQGRDDDQVTLEVSFVDGQSKKLRVKPMSSSDIPATWYI